MPHPVETILHRASLPSDLGAIRSVLAADRTLMAWIRTSLSMLSFGFTIYKFLQGAEAQNPGAVHSSSPRQVGLYLVGLGVVAMVLGTLSYWNTLRELQRSEKFRFGRPVMLMALIMSISGVAMFVGIAEHLV